MKQDIDEYEDEIWLAFVEPQYENEIERQWASERCQMLKKPEVEIPCGLPLAGKKQLLGKKL